MLAGPDALVRAGCYECLREALSAYQRIALVPDAEAAAARARQTAGLLAIRERQLGLVDEGYLSLARQDASPEDAFLLDVIATLPRRWDGGHSASSDVDLDAMMTARHNRQTWSAKLEAAANQYPLAAVTDLAFDCTYSADRESRVLRTEFAGTPLLRFTAAVCRMDTEALARLSESNPRFIEVDYFLGLADVLHGNLAAAEDKLTRAFAWHPDWPAVALALGNVAMATEDFDRAVMFYEDTDVLTHGSPEAILASLRALSYGGRHAAAIRTADRLLSGNWNRGDAYYWRAWNEAQLNENEQAWADVAEAAKLISNAGVPKLTGVLAARRRELHRARDEFQTATARDPADCETRTLLGSTDVSLGSWNTAVAVLSKAVECIDEHDNGLRAEIQRLSGAEGKGAVIKHRKEERARNQRLRAQATLNLATAAAELGDTPAARVYAEAVANDEQFGSSARALLDRLK
jgi:tetratricopeptide (TPR) repeat protein